MWPVTNLIEGTVSPNKSFRNYCLPSPTLAYLLPRQTKK